MAKQRPFPITNVTSDPVQQKRIASWIDQLSGSLKPSRFAHSISVANMSVHLAQVHRLDVLRAQQAGLLHDCAKCLGHKEMRQIAESNRLTDDETVLANPGLLHSIVGAWVAEKQYRMSDPAVLQAIRYHNTGSVGMTRLDMCVCLADSIEPLRKSYPRLNEIRALAEKSLERALLYSLETTADYVTSNGWYLHPQTKETILWLRELPETNGDY